MPTAEARVTTERASRYLVQLCRHAGQMGHGFPAHPGRGPHMGGERPKNVKAEWSETDGTITVDGGTCVLRATPEALTLRIEAQDEDQMQRIQAVLTRNLTRMSRRDNLTVDWSRPDATIGATPATVPPRRGRHTVLGLTVAGILVVAVHVGLVAGVLTLPQWASLSANVILVGVLVKAALIAAHVWRRRRASAKAH
ncbi:DUF2218 domain-containing protein [Nonomuraea sp. M3C6]|uniref:DUF2218 domain-containing protein n=1 Tax=Nonomuraea marmarensis TaxID=3351344 RepID=A0ABW7AGR9_9ACTN